MAGFGRFKLTDALPEQAPADQESAVRRRASGLCTGRQGEGQRQEEGQARARPEQAVAICRRGR